MKTKNNAQKLNVCTKTVAESFAGFSDQNLKKVALTLLGMLAKRSESKSASQKRKLVVDAIHAVDPWAKHDEVAFVPTKRVSKRKVTAA